MPLPNFANVDTSQLLFPSASLDRIAGWCADHISRGRDHPLSLRTLRMGPETSLGWWKTYCAIKSLHKGEGSTRLCDDVVEYWFATFQLKISPLCYFISTLVLIFQVLTQATSLDLSVVRWQNRVACGGEVFFRWIWWLMIARVRMFCLWRVK